MELCICWEIVQVKGDMDAKKSIVFGLISICSVLGCVKHSQQEASGYYTGTDGSRQAPSKLNITLGVAGDGNVVGLWKAEGGITNGQFSGNFGFFRNSLSLRVISGSCKGQFSGEFSVKDQDHFSGNLRNNSLCPEQSYHFDVVRAPRPKS
jgi:hypothetical protein